MGCAVFAVPLFSISGAASLPLTLLLVVVPLVGIVVVLVVVLVVRLTCFSLVLITHQRHMQHVL